MVSVRTIAGFLGVCLAMNGQGKLPAPCAPEILEKLALPCSAEEPCNLFLELAAIEQVATRLVLTGNIHTGAATLSSVLLVSDDGGRTWTEAHPRIPSAVLDQIQFLDFEAGWISGHNLQVTPKDAFFLLTTDGGKTWRRRPVTEEARTGAVEQFWFDSRSHGTLSLDRVRAAENGFRYEIWETLTGGESWSVRQVDTKPLPFTRPQREPALRIRQDAAGKIHRIERREGKRWASVATFAVSAGECSPPTPAPVPEAVPPASAESPELVPPPPSAPKGRKPPSLRRP